MSQCQDDVRLPGHGAQSYQTVAPGHQNTLTSRYGAGIAVMCREIEIRFLEI